MNDHTNNQSDTKLEIILNNAELELKAIAKQLITFSEGWFAIHIKIPTFQKEDWKTKHAKQLIQNSFKGSFSNVEKCIVLFLWDDTILLLCQKVENYRIDLKRLLNTTLVLLAPKELTEEDKIEDHTFDLSDAKSKNLFNQFCINHLKSFEANKNKIPAQFNFTLEIDKYDFDRRAKHLELVVMIIEDDDVTARLLKYTIEKRCRVLHASTGEEAKNIYENNMPNLIFLDIGLPDINGLTILKKIQEADPEAYVVMLTANGFAENVKQAMSSGAKGFIVKPFTADKINAVIDKCKATKKHL
ncbi:MAG: response regulator [Alphaproteobacteria bacterium]|nr:response regulator [Alphaproteobacteria bacterium]